MSKRNGWEHYELEKEISKSSVAGLLEIYKREKAVLTNLCLEYVQIPDAEYKTQFEDRCNLQHEAVEKVALKIADILTVDKN